MSSDASSPAAVSAFIARWTAAQAAERANYALFLSELCDVLDVPRPDPATDDTTSNHYVFERFVTIHRRGAAKPTHGRIDLYKRACFVLEAKQYASTKSEAATLALDLGDPDAIARSPKIARGTAAWDRAMLEALGQAEEYARSLPSEEDPPPFLLVVDVGHVIELYADFTQRGKNYLPFPDARTHRIRLADLARPEARDTLRAVWTDPHSLDPAKKSAAVTREVAGYLAELAKSFEKHHDPKLVAEFLSRCLFCMFAEDVGLLPQESFHQLLESVKADPGAFVPMLELLFEDMNQGRFSGLLKKKLPYFNGGLFASARALPVNGTQLGLLRRAAALEWRHVEPAIFGTLLERALHPEERHKLGAHYTPRAYVERLVLPTVIEPLRDEWAATRVAAVTLAQRDTAAALKEARATVRQFHERLCATTVLDPACGSGNFLYVALEQMKRLEGEVVALLHDLGDTGTLNLQGSTVDPHQFLGLELNPRAAALAELVLWIGYLQWHFRVHGDAMPAEPVLKKFNNIECRDAVLAWDKHAFAKDPATGKTRFVWDRKSYKTDPVTGREVPDEARVRPLDTYENPRPAAWPQADFIVGNPPFVANRKMREEMGDGYVDALDTVYGDVDQAVDFVMYFWKHAANLLIQKSILRFGFVSTSRIRQPQNRSVVEQALGCETVIVFATPDHPWDEDQTEASVRIAMTVLARAQDATKVVPRVIIAPDHNQVAKSRPPDFYRPENFKEYTAPKIFSDLSTDIDLSKTTELQSWSGLAHAGLKPYSETLRITQEQANQLFSNTEDRSRHAPAYRNGQDIARVPSGTHIVDFFGFSENTIRDRFPKAYEYLLTHTKKERAAERNPRLRREWWLFEANREEMREAISKIQRYIVTVENSPTRYFCFLNSSILPDQKLRVIAVSDAFLLGVLSSRVHTVFSLKKGGRHGAGNTPVYNTPCCTHFPIPDCTETQKARIRALAEELDAHRKRAQATHQLGLTDIYNVLEKLRGRDASPRRPSDSPEDGRLGEPSLPASTPEILTPKDRAVHDAALVSTLKQLHDELDAAVADAYGWPWPLADAEILERVVALNAARAAEEAQGLVRWLRPDYQKPLLAPADQGTLAIETTGKKPRTDAPDLKSVVRRTTKPAKAKKVAWPKTLAERVKTVEAALTAAAEPVTAAELTKRFTRAKPAEVLEILDTLAALGRARPGDEKGTYVG